MKSITRITSKILMNFLRNKPKQFALEILEESEDGISTVHCCPRCNKRLYLKQTRCPECRQVVDHSGYSRII